MTTQTDRLAAQISDPRGGRTASAPRRAAESSPTSSASSRTFLAGLRSVGTYTVVAAAIVGIGGYVAHTALAPEPASPAPLAQGSQRSLVLDSQPSPATGAKPIQITVVGGPSQTRTAGAPHRSTAVEAPASRRAVALDRRVVVAQSDGRTLQETSPLPPRAQRPLQTASTTVKVHGTKAKKGSSGKAHRADRHVAESKGRELVYQIVAADGSIVYIGDDGRLVANTGATASSGVVALDVDGSSLASGDSRGASTAGSGSHANSTFQQVAGGGSSYAVSGFEDHSVSVLGDDQLVTYDDSNVFINRNGHINANTGDTDSSGLNAVDVTDSRIRSGDSGDGESDEDNEEASAPAEQESAADSGTDESEDDQPGRDSDETSESSDADDEPADPESDSTESPVTGRTMPEATVTDEGASIAEGDHPVVVGADGYDDVSIRTRGNRNVVSYDDSNVVIGGTGDVNAQIGDSDTGGAVVMGVHGSDISAGCEGDLCGRN